MQLSYASVFFLMWLPLPAVATNTLLELGCYSTISFTPFPADFDTQVQPVFDRHCTSCHQPGGAGFDRTGLDLRAGYSYRSLVGVESTMRPGTKRVARIDWTSPEPQSLTDSYLWEKIGCSNPRGGQSMPPPPMARLSQNEQLMIQTWIDRGAAPGLAGDGRELPVQFGMTGTWFDPTLPGQGLMIEVVPSTGLFILGWLTHARLSGLPAPGVPGTWLLGLGQIEEESARVKLEITAHPGSFDHLPSFQRIPVGSATILFHSCTEATLHYRLDLEETSPLPRIRNMSLVRLTPNLLCEDAPAKAP